MQVYLRRYFYFVDNFSTHRAREYLRSEVPKDAWYQILTLHKKREKLKANSRKD